METKRITLFAGHYGSGKTNIAINFAYRLRELGLSTVIADLDTVNPYFRTKDSIYELNSRGIELIASQFAGSNVDLPALPAEMYDVIYQSNKHVVLDIGGDDRGAFALGRYTPEILRQNDYRMILVINKYRPLTPTALDTIEVMREIELASKIPFTAIVNNSNLGVETTKQTILDSAEYATEVSRLSGLPIFATTYPSFIDDKDFSSLGEEHGQMMELTLQKKII